MGNKFIPFEFVSPTYSLFHFKLMVASYITAQQEIADRVSTWADQLADSLTENYRRYHIKQLTINSVRFAKKDNGSVLGYRPDLSDYANQQLAEIENGTAKLMKFKVYTGKKYYKIVQQEFDTFQNRNEYRDGSVNCFIDKKTGEVYKPASWKAPAKHVRYDMRIIQQREYLLNPDNIDWAGGYLYMR